VDFLACKLTGSEFGGADMPALVVRGGDWSYVTLRGVDLHGIDLSGLKLREADLTDADLRGADLRGCDLGHARLPGAQLAGADLRGAQTDGIDWRALGLSDVHVDIGQALAIAAAQGVQIS
jgi:uncharacterized protein YjbI with pentapeptide repeats